MVGRAEERHADVGAQDGQGDQDEVLAHERDQDEEECRQRRAQHQERLAPAEARARAVGQAADPGLDEHVDDVVPGQDEADDQGRQAQILQHGRDQAVEQRPDDADAEEAEAEQEGPAPGEAWRHAAPLVEGSGHCRRRRGGCNRSHPFERQGRAPGRRRSRVGRQFNVDIDGGENLRYHISLLHSAARRGLPGVALPIGTDTREVRARVILAGSSAEFVYDQLRRRNLCHAER